MQKNTCNFVLSWFVVCFIGSTYGMETKELPVASPLQKIISKRHEDVAASKLKVSEKEINQHICEFENIYGPPLNLFNRIHKALATADSHGIAIAAEFKRASPSKGVINDKLDAVKQCLAYASANAAVISVLTEEHWFKGSLDDMKRVRIATQELLGPVERPAILCKDFVVDERMIKDARANGADTVLLIARILEQSKLKQLIDFSRSLKMEPLVEVYTNHDLEVALESGTRVIGVNNRNLQTFTVNLETTERIAAHIKNKRLTLSSDDNDKIILCALSGISTHDDINKFKKIGCSLALVGETLMRASNPKAAINSLLAQPSTASNPGFIVKICGITRPEDALVACTAGANLIGTILVPTSKRNVNCNQALAIAKVIRRHGERTTKFDNSSLGLPKPTSDNDISICEWYTTCASALEKKSRLTPMSIGVFQNHPGGWQAVNDDAQRAGVDAIQLHGSETVEDVTCLVNAGWIVIKALHVNSDNRNSRDSIAQNLANQIRSFAGSAHLIILDTTSPGCSNSGGAGVTFDHAIVKKIQILFENNERENRLPLIIAGGLGSREETQAAISTCTPFGVDASSKLESATGIKDSDLVADYLLTAKRSSSQIDMNKR